jgi:alpha-L-fucosidase
MTTSPIGGDLGWFTEARLGLFIHWGLYALPARHEWVKNRERLTDEDYQAYFDHFDPDLYDPKNWARLAKSAGMRYVTVTTKHHDGFCLWDSALTDYKVTNTPYGKDLIAPLVAAFREQGLKIGFYHSLIDWHHPEFPVDGVHPQRDDEEFKKATGDRDIRKYAEYLHGQVEELLTGFGHIDYLFFDFSYRARNEERFWGGKGAPDWQSEKLLARVRELQPHVVVNDRLEILGDIVTPEQYQPSAPPQRDGTPVPWEACQTLNGSWGYDRDNHDYKSPELLLRMLIDGVAKNGNLLLNIGPTGRGTIDGRSRAILEAIGEWMAVNSRSIYGCGPSDYAAPPDCRYTQRGDRLYLHVFSWPFKHLHLPGLADKLRYAQFLHDASEIGRTVIDPKQAAQNTTMPGQPEGTVTLHLPVRKPDIAVPVIELFLER